MGMTQYAEPKEMSKEDLAKQVAAAEAARQEWDPSDDPTVVPGATPAVAIEDAEVIAPNPAAVETPQDACAACATSPNAVVDLDSESCSPAAPRT